MKKAEEYVVSQTGAQSLQAGSDVKPSPQSSQPTPESSPTTKAQPSLKAAGKNAPIPTVYVEFGPAELIETRGDPVYKPIPGTGLEYVENTNGDLFRLSGKYYVLISGRWFTAASLEGPWAYVNSAEMPADFAKIPVDSSQGHGAGFRARYTPSPGGRDRELYSANRDHYPIGSQAYGVNMTARRPSFPSKVRR